MRKIGKILLSLGLAVSMVFSGQYISGGTDGSNYAKAVSKVKINKKYATLSIGETVKLKITGTKKKVTWKSSNKKIATVTSKGKVKGIKEGMATIIAKVDKKKYTCTVIVEDEYENIPVEKVTDVSTTEVPTPVSQTQVPVSLTPIPTETVQNSYAPTVVPDATKVPIITPIPTTEATQIPVPINTPFVDNEITYISDRSINYNEIEKKHKIYFSLKLSDCATRVSSSGVTNVKIVNDENDEVYNQQIRFDNSNFSYYTIGVFNEIIYLCCIEIQDEEILKSTCEKGKITFDVTLDDETSFEDTTLTISNLPLKDLKGVCKISMPSVPVVISRTYYSGDITKANVTDVNYTITKTITGKYIATINLSGQKIYDSDGSSKSRKCVIGWKLYKGDTNTVVDSGSVYTSDITVGENFENETETIRDLDEGEYRLELINVK